MIICAFAAIRRHSERGFEYIDRDTVGTYPEEVQAHVDRLAMYAHDPVIRIAPVVIAERREAHHDRLLEAYACTREAMRAARSPK